MGELKSAAFLEYLDKEMTIMGILSAFAVALAALSLERTAGADAGTTLAEIWQHGKPFILAGSVGALISALFFYLQRSLLAWFYGQIALCEIRGDGKDELLAWLENTDAWDAWFRHEAGFVMLASACVLFSFGAASALVPDIRSYLAPSIIIPIVALVVLLVLGTIRKLLVKHRLEESYPLRFLLPSKWRAA